MRRAIEDIASPGQASRSVVTGNRPPATAPAPRRDRIRAAADRIRAAADRIGAEAYDLGSDGED